MTSQGQRFRRRALRRGYKVDEVDSFLDRVEATLAGDVLGAPVSAQEVHDVVFRVRFGGYDEWQVDLHLDRVERQLAELEERGGTFGRPEPRSGELRMGPPADRMGQPGMGQPGMGQPGMGQPGRMSQPDRLGPPEGVGPPAVAPTPGPLLTGPGMQGSGPPSRGVPASPGGSGMPPRDQGYGRFDEPTYGGGGGGGGYDTGGYENVGRRGRNDMTAEIRMGGGPGFGGPPDSTFGGGSPVPASEVGRIDQLRRTFQVRRFGSGYDTTQVDRFFDNVVASLAGRTGVLVSDAELASAHFNLVPGGYFEAEVDAAVKEVRDIVSRRR